MIKEELVSSIGNENLYLYHFRNKNGGEMKVTNYGAIIVSIMVPDKNGSLDEVVLGYDDPKTYIENNPFYFGCVVGRYANRIKGSQFKLNGKTYKLNPNWGNNHLHGGIIGYDKCFWHGKVQDDVLVLSYISPDGEEKYPGTVVVEAVHRLLDDNTVEIIYKAESDTDTIINITNHSYFNLNGAKSTVLDHKLMLDADYFTPTDQELIPTGELRYVEGTPFDFRHMHKIGDRIFDEEDEAIAIGKGYDHNYVLNGDGIRKVAELYDEETGRCMDVITNQPAMQFFVAHMIPEGTQGLRGKEYSPYFGVCLEPQVSPDSPNKENFPNCILRRGETYKNIINYKFSVK